MSTSRPLPSLAERAAWQRWQMDPLHPSRAPLAEAQDAIAQAGKEAEKGQVLRAQVLEQVRKEGLAQGHEAGFESGRAQGHAQGFEQGRSQGLEAGHKEGYEKGLEQGLQEGREQGAQAAQAQVQRLAQLAEACAQSIDTIEQEVGRGLLGLAVRIAEQVLRTSLRDHPSQIIDLVQETLREPAVQATDTQLRLHPDDAQLLREWFEQSPEAAHPRVIADEHVTPGGCVVETSQGAIDATLETRWRRVIAALGVRP